MYVYIDVYALHVCARDCFTHLTTRVAYARTRLFVAVRVCVICRMSGTAYGTVVLHASPESALGGPLALVQTGDEVCIRVCAWIV